MDIIDFHTHIAAEMCFPPSFSAGVVDNMAVAMEARGLPAPKDRITRMHAGTLNDPLCDQLIAEMDSVGVAQAVLLIPDFTYALKDSTHTIAEVIDHHRDVVERHPGRFKVFAGVDPRWGDDGIALFEKSVVEYGFDGLKLYPPCGYTLADERLYPFYEICAQYGLPVLSHIGATSPALDFEIALPIHVDRPARDFPSVDFVLAHGTVHYPDECAMLCNNRPNIYIDASGYEAPGGVGRLREMFGRGINHKILFGTDWPIFRLQGKQADLIDRLEAQHAFPDDMPEIEREMFFHRNAARLLGRKRLRKVTHD